MTRAPILRRSTAEPEWMSAGAARAVNLYQDVCDLPTMAQPNAGQPVLEKMKVVYKQTAEEMVAELPALLETGVNIVGGCCGSTPDHIRLFRKILDERGNSRRAVASDNALCRLVVDVVQRRPQVQPSLALPVLGVGPQQK